MTRDPAIFQTARQHLPLPHLMTKIGDGAFAKEKGALCPFCGGKDVWGIFQDGNGRWRFKCQQAQGAKKSACVANEPQHGHNEIGYLVLRQNLDVKQASIKYLELAVPELLEEQAKKEKAEPQTAPEPKDDRKVISMRTGDAVPPPPSSDDPKPPKKKDTPNPWHALWQKLVLNGTDRAKLKNRRGFTDETIDKLGFKSNNQSNRIHLEALAQEFPIDLLVSEGIFVPDKKSGGYKPNAQFLGWGITNKKKENGERIWDWTEPTLIPYLDEDRQCFYIRPHKGGARKPHDEEDDDSFCSSHVYCPFLLADLEAGFDGAVVLTEGEHKADALFQCGIPALAIPGITFVRNLTFREELVGLLRRFGITDVVVCFDNEVKDDPRYQDKYKADPWDRWDTPMWAEFIAIDLQREYFSSVSGDIRIGVIPDELREDGKADFDSVLAHFVKKHGPKDGTDTARKVFRQIIEEAKPQRQSRELFPSESRRIIECKLARLFYKPLVATGSDKEARLARRFQFNAKELSDAFRSTIGCYYKRIKPDKKERKGLIADAHRLSEDYTQAREKGVRGPDLRKLRNLKDAAWERVRGVPQPISDFTLTCDYKLHTADGKAIRLVKIRNRSDTGKSEPGLLRLGAAEMSRTANFRQWCLDTGRAVWKGGEKELQDLTEDMDHHSYFRDIFEINYYGFHRESALWFYGDCAPSPSGDLIIADANNIFWSGGIGYQVDSTVDERGTTFEQGAPLLLAPHDAKPNDLTAAQIFDELRVDLFNTLGNFEAWLALGILFAYAIAPELVKRGGHPGLWASGIMSSGKTTILRWLSRIWGFRELGGIRLDETTTHVGMNRDLAQYSCLPVFFDEYRHANIDSQKEAVLRGAFDRNSGSKGLADHTNRTRSAKIYTTPLVGGESSSSDAATRSRYAHINVSEKKRIGDGSARYAKIQSACKHYYKIGRFLMENRTRFAELAFEKLDLWLADKEARQHIINERVRFVYGTAWAAFSSLCELLKIKMDEDLIDFREFLYKHGEQALQDVASETFLNKFWMDIISGIQRGKIKRMFFEQRFVRKADDNTLTRVNANDKDAIEVCYIAFNPVFDEYSQDIKTRGETKPLDIGDLRRDMSKEPYFMTLPKSDQNRVHRITLSGRKTSCWVINLEKPNGKYIFPFGEDLVDALATATKTPDQIEQSLSGDEEP